MIKSFFKILLFRFLFLDTVAFYGKDLKKLVSVSREDGGATLVFERLLSRCFSRGDFLLKITLPPHTGIRLLKLSIDYGSGSFEEVHQIHLNLFGRFDTVVHFERPPAGIKICPVETSGKDISIERLVIKRLKGGEVQSAKETISSAVSAFPAEEGSAAVFDPQKSKAVHLPDRFHFAVDKCLYVPDVGFMVVGWFFSPSSRMSITALRFSVDGREISSDLNKMVRFKRKDVYENYKDIYRNMEIDTGYFMLIPFKDKIDGFNRLNLEIFLGEESHSLEMSKQEVEKIPLDMRIVLNKTYELCGHAVSRIKLPHLFEVMHEVFSSKNTGFSENIAPEYRNFGMVSDDPEISLIIPLYGRFDFLKHQLAHFCRDRIFKDRRIEIIYVIDDPQIIEDTLNSCEWIYRLFALPFRLVWYNRNLGFAGANNVGVKIAKGKYVVLMNSDVIPKESGWIEKLHAKFSDLPDAGVVAPTLLYFDGTIQHVGMYSSFRPEYPGLLFNLHYYKGMFLDLSDFPEHIEVPLLTGALMFLRKDDYLKVGGFDESFVFGDFEDSDFCLKMKKLGYKFYILPHVQLYHLERQSQNLITQSMNYRHFVTLYNSYIYTKRVLENGLLEEINREVLV
ncbi:glycosyltransferase family 2 protein [Thermosulfurimonas dismutans]|uniref:Glycosyl transferase, group 2 family protein n=1 Tax=Thermosulfurimonas dismutans TaxID=999894 RepID=A0A179D1D6_9BACT|nr:glycosyltransferase family 2 protein [Thermosulfurimonas dismutans]OAQ19867.1 Glycosyl transferase, group 2 family protein [Thermosulfurimonas dismutans]